MEHLRPARVLSAQNQIQAMIKKIRKPSQSKVKTSAQTTRNMKPNAALINRKPAKKPEVVHEPEDVNIEDIILE